MVKNIIKFAPAVWAEIHFNTVLTQYDKRAVFTDAYFEALNKRRDEKSNLYWKLTSFQIIIQVSLVMAAFGISTEVTQFGIKIQIDKFKELLLLVYAIISFFLAIMKNDIMMMRAVLKAKIRRQIDAIENIQLEWLRDQASKTLDMQYMDKIGDSAVLHVLGFIQNRTILEKIRAIMIGIIITITGASIVIIMILLQGFVIYNVFSAPSFHFLFSWSVCTLSILSSLAWVVLHTPYWVDQINDSPPKVQN